MTAPAQASRRAAVVDAAALTAAVLLFFAPAFQPGLQFLARDTGRMHHPAKAWIAGELRRGHLPEWNPLVGLGAPEVAGAVDAVLHPFNLLLVALPFELGFKAWILLSEVAAALGAAALARQLGAGRAAAVAAGLAFALGGALVSSTDNLTYLTAAALAPWLITALVAFGRSGGAGALLGVLTASYLVMSAGDPVSWAIAAAGGAAGCLLPTAGGWLPTAGGWRRLRRLATGLVVALLGAAPTLLPLLRWVPYSSRGEPLDWIEHAGFSLLWSRLPELALPGLFRAPELGLRSPLYVAYAGDTFTLIPWLLSIYLGAAALALAAAGALRRPLGRLLLATALLLLWMAMGRYGGFGQLARGLPILGTLRYWEKLAIWLPLLVGLAAAAGIDELSRDARLRRGLAAGAGAAGLLLALLTGATQLAPAALASLLSPPGGDLTQAAVLVGNLGRGAGHAAAVLLALAAAAAAGTRLGGRLGLALTLLLAVDLAVANSAAWLLSPIEVARPSSPLAEALRGAGMPPRLVTPFPLPTLRLEGLEPAEASWYWGARSLYSGWAVERGVANFEAYAGAIPVRASRYRRRAGLLRQLPGVGLWGVSHAVVPEPPERAAEMNLAPPYRVEARDPLLGTALLAVAHRPRAYLAEQVRSVDRRAAMEFALDDASVGGQVTVVEAAVPPGLAAPAGEAAVVEDLGERVTVAASSDGPALLVLNDIFAEGWTATLDGAPVEILPANYLARGVWMPAGQHRVTFTYRTPGLSQGLLLLGLGLALVAGWAAVARARAGAATGAAGAG